MTTTVDIDPSELDDSPIIPLDIAPLICQEPGCTNAVNKPPRGRTPKFCDEHKSRPKTANNSNKSKASGKSWTRATEIETHLSNSVLTVGSLTGHFVDETDGELIKQFGPNIVHELVELAKDDKRLQEWLVWLSAPGKYGPLVASISALIVPIYLNHAAKAALARAARQQAAENEAQWEGGN